jgi:TolB-like protein/Flp pilus assembly protein TadD
VDAAPDHGAFSLGDWLVEPSLNRLTRAGEVHHLRPRLMDLLVYLAQHPGQVVTKDQLLEEVWHQRFAAESVLSRSVAELRQLLGDEVQRPRVIETIPKRGYRLVAAVSEPGPGSSDRPAYADPRPSIVVLPFLDLAPTRDHEYFCDGLAEELTNRLAHLPGLRVVARTSAFSFKGKPADVRDIGRQLNVRAVLEGSVQRSGDRLRVTAQLVDASDGCHAWSGRFDRPASDIFAIEDEIAQAVVSELRVRLLGEADARVMHRQTTNSEAHDAYLQARHHSSRRTLEGLESAIRLHERALELDPGYAAAHAGIAECCCVIGFVGYRRPADVLPRGRLEAERALLLDPGLGEAHAILAHALGMFEWRWEEAEQHFLRALDLNPGYSLARTWYSHLLTASGRFDEALAHVERACECDPLAPTVQAMLGLTLYYARQFDRAADCCRKVVAMAPRFGLARFFLGRICWAQGHLEAAAEQFQALGAAFLTAPGYLAGVLRALGREREADAAREALEQLSRAQYVSPLAFAASTPLSDHETRLRWITLAVDEREGTVPLLNADPIVDDLRFDPAFQALLDRLGLPRVQPPQPGPA